jgi:hypothetical protein
MADMKQQMNHMELGRERFGGAVADLALQQTAMVPVPGTAPIVWQMGTVWGTVTAQIAIAQEQRHAIQ